MTAKKPELGPLRTVDSKYTTSIADAQSKKHEAERQIRAVLSQFEAETGLLVCDIGHWHREFADGKQLTDRVEMRVELR